MKLTQAQPQRRRLRRQKGSTLLESSLILLTFLTCLIAAFDLGLYLFIHESLNERVRSALRYGSVNTFDAASIQNMVLYGQAAIPTGQSPAFNLDRSMISVSRLDAGLTEDRVNVTLVYSSLPAYSPGLRRVLPGMTITQTLPYEVP